MNLVNLRRLFFRIIIFSFASLSLWAKPKNVIFMIGDGMGFEEVKAASMYRYGESGKLFFESFPSKGKVTTVAYGGDLTDSAAASTALATGQKVERGVLSLRIPGNGKSMPTLLEIYKESGAYTGLVTTTYINHATPAGFGAHQKNRKNYRKIAKDYLYHSHPNVLLGGNKRSFWGSTINLDDVQSQGYFLVQNREELLQVSTEKTPYLAGIFGKNHLPYELDGLKDLPHLSDMTRVSLSLLDNNEKGYFVMIEGGRIDHAGHNNNLEKNIHETLEFEKSVQIAYEWVKKDPDTLLIVTADHETGGLKVIKNNGKGKYPKVSWSSKCHTKTPVPVYAIGKDSEKFSRNMDNTDFFKLILEDSSKK